MKLQERGRGKYRPAPNPEISEIRSLLLEKIHEEKKQYFINGSQDDLKLENLTYEEKKCNVLSLFSGAGGLDLGLELAGLDVIFGQNKVNELFQDKETFNSFRDEGIFHHVYANDIFNEALETYKKNFPETVFTHNCDIRKVYNFPSEDKIDILVGGPPCPGYSAAGPRLIDDPRNFLYLHYIRALMQVQPKFFIMENVKGMLTLGKGEVFKQIKQDFEATGYRIYPHLVNARDYGAPQIRERIFLIGVRDDIEDFGYDDPPIPTHGTGPNLMPFVTLRDAIGDLEKNPGDVFEGSYSSIFMSRNRKKSWDEQSFTIQASGRQAPIHPGGLPMKKIGKDQWIFPDGEENNRRLSVKEIARIQTFPDWYEFSDGKNSLISKNGRLDKVYKQIGNAVPVQLARAIAKPIAEYLHMEVQKKEEVLVAQEKTS
ncbi:DNA cytosine methyltransferase [Niallia oryzisoli]|uniref:DNA cytosine methyltransferase n=1 Tax=Niallia oryzisoli TaxID=1737571 RepID=UPI003735849B